MPGGHPEFVFVLWVEANGQAAAAIGGDVGQLTPSAAAVGSTVDGALVGAVGFEHHIYIVGVFS